MDPYPPPLDSSGSSQESNGGPEKVADSSSSSASSYNNGGSSSGDDARNGAAGQGPAAQTVQAACLACRGKHLKCDGLTPCSRCQSSQSECVYIASRRGYKGPRRNGAANPNKRHASGSPDDGSGTGAGDSCPMLLGATPVPLSTASFSPALALPGTQPGTPFSQAPPAYPQMHLYRNPFLGPADPNGVVGLAQPLIHQNKAPSLAERCLDSFYHHFHAGHPFVLPREFLLKLAKEGRDSLEHLLAAVRYVGSLYLDAGPARAMYLDEAIRVAYLPTTPKDGFLVQTLLLVIVALDGSCQQERARHHLADCERIAIEIALNTRQFAADHGRGSPVLEESWRRTWWDLYVCDGMIAGVHRITNFLLFDVPADVALPCEEHQYASGNIPQPMYIEDFDDQLFSGEDREFSSFTYRIAAIRNLGRFMRTPPILFPDDVNLDKIESLLTNWRLHLPPSKKDSLNKNCGLDEMMFQAHFITNACTIMLHQPHSQLDTTPARSVNSCAPYRAVPSGDTFNAHTRHTLRAAGEISKMITHAVPILSHTHFFTCVITMSSIVHLSQWALYYLQDEDDLRQQIRLNIGALQRLSAVWKAADTASGQVKGVAQEIYRAKKAQQINPAFWVGFTQEEMISSLNADEAIISEFNSMIAQVTQPPHAIG